MVCPIRRSWTWRGRFPLGLVRLLFRYEELSFFFVFGNGVGILILIFLVLSTILDGFELFYEVSCLAMIVRLGPRTWFG